MNIYVASSWRNEIRQQAVVKILRAEGHEVYDFRNPAPGDTGFSWRQCSTGDELKDPISFRRVLNHPIAQEGFNKDWNALTNADVTVLVLPCGRSAHLELGVARGMQQRTIVLLDDPISEPELMYLACTNIAVSISEVVELLNTLTFFFKR